ncbi:hypothetical protein CSAL01_06845 [Colletotrichum salicis]|uniref:Uncharacterized protein n=1 Tax=Colletotrichum salicis TaxID=1209931 RepID=A0A135URR2_9PEZI|nr:hypothetical protein CSAL01_06845 [Colletotrichum salicis]
MQTQKHLTNARRDELVGRHDVTLQHFSGVCRSKASAGGTVKTASKKHGRLVENALGPFSGFPFTHRCASRRQRRFEALGSSRCWLKKDMIEGPWTWRASPKNSQDPQAFPKPAAQDFHDIPPQVFQEPPRRPRPAIKKDKKNQEILPESLSPVRTTAHHLCSPRKRR